MEYGVLVQLAYSIYFRILNFLGSPLNPTNYMTPIDHRDLFVDHKCPVRLSLGSAKSKLSVLLYNKSTNNGTVVLFVFIRFEGLTT